MPKTSKAPICDKAAFDAYPYHVNGRAITAKVVMFSVAEKLELELAELRQQIERMKCCDNCGHGKAGGYTCPFNCACDHDKKIFKDWKPR